jgi:hypothetical protein
MKPLPPLCFGPPPTQDLRATPLGLHGHTAQLAWLHTFPSPLHDTKDWDPHVELVFYLQGYDTNVASLTLSTSTASGLPLPPKPGKVDQHKDTMDPT